MRAKLCLVLLALALLPAPSLAIPVFARKYGVNCTMCHTAYPRLNDFGVRYRLNVYLLPGKEGEDKTVLESPTPFAARANGGLDVLRGSGAGAPQALTQFRFDTLDLLSAGVFGPHRSYLVAYRPPIPPGPGLAGQDASLEMAAAVFRHLGSPWVNLRIGRFEAAFTAFSVARQLSLSPYEIYGTSFPGGSTLAEPQQGIELYGWCAQSRLRYAAGWINGSKSNPLRDFPADFYARATYVFGEGEGETAGQRVGLTGYVGFARPEAAPGASRQPYSRLGVDASLNWMRWNLALQALWERDPAALWGSAAPIDVLGGFAELSWFPAVRWALFARGDVVFAPRETGHGEVYRGTAGARLYPMDQLAFHLEYSYRVQAAPAATEQFATVRVDYAF